MKRRQYPSHVLALVMCWLAAMLAPAAPAFAAATPNEEGLPLVRNFDPAEYGGATQNWSLAQDRQGVIYVGNVEDGVLSFDGSRWRRIPVPDHATVRSLALGRDGRLYVGTVGDLGYLKPDASGQLAFVSLLERIPPAERHFADVWAVHATADGVFFATATQLFRYRNGRMDVWKPQTSFHLSFLVDGTLYVREVGRGLMRLVGDRLERMPGSERFAAEKIYALLPWHGPGARPGDLLVGTRTQGWFIRRGDTFQPWPTEADAAIRQGALYGAIWLADGRLAVATLRGGLFLLDAQGHLLRSLTRASGLSTNVVLALFQDRQRGLWVATGNGVSRINVDSPLTRFGERGGLQGSVLAVQRHAGTLYVGSTEGLFRLVAGANAHFEPIPQVAGQVWGFASVDGQLLAAGNEGVFAVADGKARQLLDDGHGARSVAADSLLRSARDPSRVFVGYQDGIGTLRQVDGHWVDEGRIAGVQEEVRAITQDAGGHLWLSLWAHGVIRLSLPPGWQGPRDATAAVKVERFAAGLPEGQNQAVTIDGGTRFINGRGIYRFDAATGRFAADPAFAGLFPDGARQVDALYQDRRGEVWMYVAGDSSDTKQTGRAIRDGNRWRWEVTPLQMIAGVGTSVFRDDPDGTVWIGSDKGLFRYRPMHAVPPDAQFHALLREVVAHDGQMLFAGAPPAGDGKLRIPYAQDALRFEFAAPSYDNFAANRYEVWLQGIDRGWSHWSSDTYRDYTNLPEGRYRFRVRALDVYGRPAREAVFDFRILPPWYRTAWAWLLWIATGVLVLGLLVHWRSTALRRRNRALATLVAQRTAELARSNLALQQANEALAQQIVTDPLTGLKNRRYLSEHIERDLAVARRHSRDWQARHPGGPSPAHLLFLMVDIDHFKEINDTYGHATGDHVLLQFRDVLLAVTRESDTPVRRGGEEFLVVARSAPPGAGPQFAERIRAAVDGHRFDLGNGGHLHLTCSIGFANYPFFASEPERLDWEQVVNIADECLYAAKRQGRNAWAGVTPVAAPPAGDVIDALREALAGVPGPGPLPVLASWACAELQEA